MKIITPTTTTKNNSNKIFCFIINLPLDIQNKAIFAAQLFNNNYVIVTFMFSYMLYFYWRTKCVQWFVLFAYIYLIFIRFYTILLGTLCSAHKAIKQRVFRALVNFIWTFLSIESIKSKMAEVSQKNYFFYEKRLIVNLSLRDKYS